MLFLLRSLGGLSFALLLLALTILFVAAGTLIESSTDSHLRASALIYDHPLFILLLLGFFLNISAATLRRWPFTRQHTPFILTHIGLLMILAGVMGKKLYGLQGQMELAEGTASSQVSFPHEPVVTLETASSPSYFDRTLYQWPPTKSASWQPFEGVEITLDASYPHVETNWEMWIKEGKASIMGLSIPFYTPTEVDGWTIIAMREEPLPFIAKPTLFIVEKEGVETLTALLPTGERTTETFTYPKGCYSLREGFGGYIAALETPDKKLFQTSLKRKCTPLPPTEKPEQLRPMVQLTLSWAHGEERVELPFDPISSPIATPVMRGYALMRYRPRKESIPCTLRLRRATKRSYPGSTQASHYEAEILVTDRDYNSTVEVTLAMNHVFESPSGYRFYLASMGPSKDGTIQQITLIVNHDPVRYWLTYPGCLLVVLAGGWMLLRAERIG